MQDELLAECLDELLHARRDGLPLDPDRVRARFPGGGADPRLIDFFVQLCECADDWRGPPPDATQASDADTPPPEGPAPAPGVAPMTLGRYRILERVAAGGMGTVYKAFDPTLGRVVALKVPHIDPEHPRFEELAEQFVQEARLAAAVDHPNVCAVYDAGRHEGTPFVVMAFVEGSTLSARLKAHQRFDDLAAADLVRRVAEGLHAAHQRKIVHRDIKPGNILLRSSDGQPILTDFGLARVAQEGAFVTRPGVIAGTVAYMAPEQAAGDAGRIGPATDVYGLGAVLYQMVTGRLPFDGDVPVMLARIQRADAPAPSQVRPDLDPALDAIIRRAMARDPADRYRDAGELAATLRAIGSPADSAPTASYRQAPTTRDSRRTRKRVWIAASLALLLTAGAGFGWNAFFRTTAANGPAVPPLDGELVVRVWTDPNAVEPNPRPKLGVAVDDKSREALPVRNIDTVHLEVRLNRPAYAYVLWFPGEGGPPQPLFPWNPHPTQGFRSSPEQRKVTEVHSPARPDQGWGVTGPSGLETAVLLARDTPLGAAELAELEAAIGTLPATPLGSDLRECAWLWRERGNPDGWTNRGTLRGIDTSASRDFADEPVFALLKRMQPKFDLVKAVRFAHVGDDLGAKPKPVRSGGNP